MFDNQNLADMRRQYRARTLERESVSGNPFLQFESWFNEAGRSGVIEPNAMILATSSATAIPSVRTVLLKKFDTNGFVFFTNYKSHKATDLQSNPTAEILFFWPELERQIRIHGSILSVSAQESDEYFKSRPERSKLAAWASPQSEIIPNREYLEQKTRDFEKKFIPQKKIPRPPHWGGYRLQPETFEFWQGREDRLHDRLFYKKSEDAWIIERLAP